MLQWSTLFAQQNSANKPPKNSLRVMSYNVENLYDTIDDQLTDDAEFLPKGQVQWTEPKYRQKVSTIAGVISNLGEWNYPALIGLVEIENSEVIKDLVTHPKLSSQDYKQAVSLAADPRGIDVALLWHPKHFKMIEAKEIPHYGSTICYPYRRDLRSISERNGSGRNTLWVTLQEKSTGVVLDVFVVHLPSRRGGVNSTSEKRIEVTQKIFQIISSIQKQRADARIIVMGDFNDNPTDVAVRKGFSISSIDGKKGLLPTALYNLATPLLRKGKGTHYFGRKMWMPDQFIVSGTLLDPTQPISVQPSGMKIYSPANMQIDGRPRRSFYGTKYTGGFSDHFPIYFDLILSK